MVGGRCHVENSINPDMVELVDTLVLEANRYRFNSCCPDHSLLIYLLY